MPPRRASSICSDINKPLPPSPTFEQRNGKPSSLRGFLRREPPSQLQNMHLRPEPYSYEYSTSNTDSTGHYHHRSSRSMPNSPRGFYQSSTTYDHTVNSRNQSAATNYPESVPYTTHPERQDHTMYSHERSFNSTSNYFDTITSSRYPPSSDFIPRTRDNVTSRARPHTWLSPTEPFTDISQFHLFAEAMTGLPSEPECTSPSSPPRLQGSLFARRSRNDTIPIPLQYPQDTQPIQSRRSDWQDFEPPSIVASRSVSVPTSPPSRQWRPPPHMRAVDRELEILGLEDEHGSDDELPDYAQSQAEMSARKRAEASARARELEARWRDTRGR